jgi:CubicO group peptidase (beta-lactamase class C family)
MDVNGFVDPKFERVINAFEQNFARYGDIAAQCCVHIGGQPVVDLWKGCKKDAVQMVFSATKGATAACANLLVQRGVLDLDSPVVRYWPEYGQNGKEKTLVRWILSHKAGVLGPDPKLSLDDLSNWSKITDSLAAQKPDWEPGTAYGYHAQSFGWLVGELVRRVDGRSLGNFFADEIARPAKADFWIGFPEVEEHRLLPVFLDNKGFNQDMEASTIDFSSFLGPFLMKASSFNGIIPEIEIAAQDRRCRAVELGSAGGVTNGRGLSRLYGWLLEAFKSGTIADILRPETEGTDIVLSSPAMIVNQFVGRGFMVPPVTWLPRTTRIFGHGGAGGSYGFADPERHIAFGYAMTRLDLRPDPMDDPRFLSLVKAVYDSLE